MTSTSFDARVSAPTSTSGIEGSPMRISLEDLGMKRTRPENCEYEDFQMWDMWYSRLKDGMDILKLEYEYTDKNKKF